MSYILKVEKKIPPPMNTKSFLILSSLVLVFLAFSFRLPQIKTSGQVKGVVTSQEEFNLEPKLIPLEKNKSQPLVYLKNGIVLEKDSKYSLWERAADQTVSIASLTKVMTALVVLEKLDLEKEVVIDTGVSQVIGSIIGLLPGEKITVKNLFEGLLISSGNDAAYTLGQAMGGEEETVKLMNEKAKSFGFKNTIFKDTAGLDNEGKSTARELAILMSIALENPAFSETIKIGEKDISSADGKITHHLENSNRLVTEEMFFPGILGGKTGFTPEAGHNMIAAAKRGDLTLISVVLSTTEDSKTASAKETAKLLNWGFENFVF